MSGRDGGHRPRRNAANGVADIAAAITESLAAADYRADLAARGVTIVALDEEGRIGAKPWMILSNNSRNWNLDSDGAAPRETVRWIEIPRINGLEEGLPSR